MKEKGNVVMSVSLDLDYAGLATWIRGHRCAGDDAIVVRELLTNVFEPDVVDELMHVLKVHSNNTYMHRLSPDELAWKMLEFISEGKWSVSESKERKPSMDEVLNAAKQEKFNIRSAKDLQRHTAILINPDVIKFVVRGDGALGVLSSDEKTVLFCGGDGTYRVLNAKKYTKVNHGEFGLLRILGNSVKYGDIILSDLDVKNDRAAYIMRYDKDRFCCNTDSNDIVSVMVPIADMPTIEVFKVVRLQKI